MSFSALDRHLHLTSFREQHWDLIIIGGGITGAGILLDAVSRGLKVALIEKGDFASGTSSKSTKLIHGGLRYLKNLEIGLVKEVGLERAIVYKNARHLVRPEPMLLPIYHDGSIGRITGSIGLWFYDLLADVDKTERRKMLSREETIVQEPLLKTDGLLGSGLYYEYRTDDARLTISILKTAVGLGAATLNYVQAIGFVEDEGMIRGVIARDVLSGLEFEMRAHVVVNATGPWLDDVLQLQNKESSAGKKLLLSKGVHIVVPHSKLPINQSMYFDVNSDGRMIFCIPREKAVYIGTTDTLYEDALNDPKVHQTEIQYLLEATNHILLHRELNPDDVIGTWAGLRPLIYEEGKSPTELSRKDEIFISPNGLISIAGGKLTGYRKMAERIVDLVFKSPEFKFLGNVSCRTAQLCLSGADFESDDQMQVFLNRLSKEFHIFSEAIIEKMFFRYGAEAAEILSLASDIQSHSRITDVVSAEVSHAIRHEMVHSLSDFLLRRTADVYFDNESFIANYEAVVAAFSAEFDWDSGRLAVERKAFLQGLDRNEFSQGI